MFPVLLFVIAFLNPGAFGDGSGRNVSSRPAVVNVGAIFTFDSAIGRVAKIAIDAAVADINADSSVLRGIKLNVTLSDSNSSGFLGIVEALQFMEKDTVAIIGPQSSTIAHVMSHVANELQVPTLSFAATDPSLASLQYPFFVRTTQSDLYQMSAIAAVVDYYHWKEVVALYIDDDYGRNGISALGDKFQERTCKISFKAALPPGMTSSDITDVLVKLALMESRVIVVHVSDPVAGLMIFSVAKHLDMVADGYVWIATDWLSSYLDTYPANSETTISLQGVLMTRQHVPDSDQKKAFTSRWTNLVKKEGMDTSMLGLNTYGLYAYDTVWLIAYAANAFLDGGGTISFSSDPKLNGMQGSKMNLQTLSLFNGGKQLLKRVLEANFTALTGKIQFDSDRYLVRPAYDIINVVGTARRVIGYWSNYSELSVEAPESLYSRPPNASNQQLHNVIWPGGAAAIPRGWVFANNGRQLRIGIPNRFSYKEFVSVVNGTDTVKGFCIDVFVAAVNNLPYALTYKFIPFGNGKANPSYRELVRMVQTGFFDAAVGDIAIVTDRTRAIDFTQPYAESGLVVVAPTKRTKSGAWAFLRPFTLKMWGGTVAFLLVMGMVIWILEHKVNRDFRGTPKKQVATVLWFSFSTMFFAHREEVVSVLGRLVLIMWLFVVLIVNSSYTASLTSILTVQQLSSPITGIDSLISSGEPIGFQVGSFAEKYLIDLGVRKSRLIELGSPEAYAAALEKGPANGGVAAVVDERPYIDLFLSKYCKFSVRGNEFTKSGWGLVFPRDSPLTVDFSTAILTLAESGELQRIHDKWLKNSGCSSQSTDISSDQLDLNCFWGLFLICAMASVLALSLYFIRIFIQQKHQPDVSADVEGGSRSCIWRCLLFLDKKEQSKLDKMPTERTLSSSSVVGPA
ncbi:glutamate receptor 3.3-like [Nymphaea colorata]|nr:glutamate receptor 3.3-like [Nymphaea colorata]